MGINGKRPIYLDYHATTPVDNRIGRQIQYYMSESFGNPNSIEHIYGTEGQLAVTEAKQFISQLVHCSVNEIIFTSGATESINLAIQGIIHGASRKSCVKKRVIAVSPTEHKAVLETCNYLQRQGLASVIMLDVDSYGRIDLQHLVRVCSAQPDLLCVMAANNEIGTINDIKSISSIAKEYDIPFLCDASQAVGRIHIDFEELGITFLAFTSHKIYGPKGIGALIIKNGTEVEPLFFGGGQQRNIRPGTLNVPGIVGLGEACRLRSLEMIKDEYQIMLRRDKLQDLLLSLIPEIRINGDVQNRLSGNLHISIPGISNGDIITLLRSKIAISSGSACSSSSPLPSHVLKAIGLPDEQIRSSLRIGLGKYTSNEDVEQAANIIAESVKKLRGSTNRVTYSI
ncbi:cysteine desulfurase family protein [Paenibacillus algorifonticola]|uniref:cysteine desulfurase family protein n=1 Tax=Paenibacillus algorifonticola TaxID=684063 RepID=UPI003D2BC79E